MSTEPIRIDMSRKDNGLGEALMEAMLSGRPIVMHDSTKPELGEVVLGMELDTVDNTEAGGSDGR